MKINIQKIIFLLIIFFFIFGRLENQNRKVDRSPLALKQVNDQNSSVINDKELDEEVNEESKEELEEESDDDLSSNDDQGPAPASGAMGQLKVFLIDESGKALMSNQPGILTYRMKLSNQKGWLPTKTLSNYNGDFSGKLALNLTLKEADQVAIGVYSPVGYSVLKMIHEVPNCDWDVANKEVPSNLDLYSIYESAQNDSVHSNSADQSQYRSTLIKSVPGRQTTCLAFMLKQSFQDYSQYAKLNPDPSGKFDPSQTYYERPFSSGVGLNKMEKNQVSTLNSIDSNGQVRMDVSHTLGGVIQALYLQQSGSNKWTQLINQIHPADSGMQWTEILKDSYSNTDVGIVNHKEMIFNQAIGGNPSWMWGLEMPLISIPGRTSSLQSKPGLWVPLYSEVYTAQKVEDQWNSDKFDPRSPLFLPQAAHLFDARIEEVSLNPVQVTEGGGKISRVVQSWKTRTHVKHEFSAKPIRLEWISLKYHSLRQLKTAIYTSVNNQNGSKSVPTFIGDLEHSWPKGSSSSIDESSNRGDDDAEMLCSGLDRGPHGTDAPVMKDFSKACGQRWLKEVTSISLVLSPREGAKERVVSFHLPDFKPFKALVKFSSGTTGKLKKSLEPKHRRNSTLLIAIYYHHYANQTNPVQVFDSSSESTDSLQISIGSDSDLKKLNSGLGGS